MKRLCKLLLPSFLFVAVTATAQDDVFKALVSAKSLKCEFGPGSVGKWSGANVTVQRDTFDVTLHFDSINAQAGKARLIGNQGAADVAVLLSSGSITFVEQTGAGNFAFTTIFPERVPGTDEFYVVTSRHMVLLSGRPLASQYHGKCKVWQ